MARACDQCGTSFLPRREHARFCSADCRVAWNRENKAADPVADVNALAWSITGMKEAAERVSRARAWDKARAFAVISEAVWWVTIVDATLVRYHADVYDRVLSEQMADEQALIADTLGGLRFVRNQIGRDVDRVGLIRPQEGQREPVDGCVGAWIWSPLPEPSCESFSPDRKEWELTRYRSYQAQLAGHLVGETFDRSSDFLKLAAGSAIEIAQIAIGDRPTARLRPARRLAEER
jgi:hypothetical protein